MDEGLKEALHWTVDNLEYKKGYYSALGVILADIFDPKKENA